MSGRESHRVSNHYDRKTNAEAQRVVSRILGLKQFNNWVKSVLINDYAKSGYSVLDLCCGKGGDLKKFQHAKIAHLVGVDFSARSIQDMKERFDTCIPPYRFEAKCIVGDVSDPGCAIDSVLPEFLEFDLVTCQFALNYLFKAEENVRAFLYNVSCRLKPGGCWVGTCTDANVLVRKLRSAPGLIIDNSYYNIKFNQKQFPRSDTPFGITYGFYLEDSVGTKRPMLGSIDYDRIDEFLIIFEVLEKIAKEYGLELTYKKNFHHLYYEYQPKYQGMFHRMVKAPLDEEMWDCAYLYIAFAFTKEGEFEKPPSQTHVENPTADIIYMKEELK